MKRLYLAQYQRTMGAIKPTADFELPEDILFTGHVKGTSFNSSNTNGLRYTESGKTCSIFMNKFEPPCHVAQV